MDANGTRIYKTFLDLLKKGTVSRDGLRERIALIADSFGMQINVDEMYDDLLTALDTEVEDGSTFVDTRNHEEWLMAARSHIQWDCWKRYEEYLATGDSDLKVKPLPDAVIRGIDRTSEAILRNLENPHREGCWDRRGMLVGNVQSGKTGNYLGLVCKAIDAGYKLIVIMAGLNNDLRSQTQERLDAAVIGYSSHSATRNNRIGVGKLFKEDSGVTSVTGADASGDYRKVVFSNVTCSLKGQAIVYVVKKNVTPLTNFLEFAKSMRNAEMIHDVPLLMIDDEADNASINVGHGRRRRKGEPIQEDDPSTINGLIRKILKTFDKVGYVGCTATPFANIFIAPDFDLNRSEYGDDLFPQAFIHCLPPPPPTYMGPTRVFGLQKDSLTGQEAKDPLPLIRTMEDYDVIFPEKHDKNLIVSALPLSLQRAVKAFILSCAVRSARGQRDKHMSMLVHVTRFVDVQKQVVELLQDYMFDIKSLLDTETTQQYRYLMEDLVDLWANDFQPTTLKMNQIEATIGQSYKAVTWEQVREHLREAANRIEVRGINGDSASGNLDYANYKDEGASFIAVGGNKLSRGLTLEGLSVSYYTRMTKMYDTLLQMGRWFGYRAGYADVCRLYTNPTLVSWYRHLASVTEELRQQLMEMAAQGATPREFGLKVRQHPDGMMVTAMNKRGTSSSYEVTFADTLRSSTIFYRNSPQNSDNLTLVRSWLPQLGAYEAPDSKNNNNYTWRNVPAEQVIHFLEQYKIHPKCASSSPKLLVKYIRQLLKGDVPELKDWTVGLVSANGGAQEHLFGDCTIGKPWRTNDAMSEDIISLIRSQLITENDEFIDLSESEYEDAFWWTQTVYKEKERKWQASYDEQSAAWANLPKEKSAELEKAFMKKRPKAPTKPTPRFVRKARPSERGLLLIYVFQSGTKDENKVQKPYDETYVGFAVSFPHSRSQQEVSYLVGDVYRMYNDEI